MDEGALNYLRFLYDSKGKIMLSPLENEKLTNIIIALEEREDVMNFLGYNVITEVDRAILHEVAIVWFNEGVMHKALIDLLEIDHEKKIVYITDVKTTSDSIPTFMGRKVIEPAASKDYIDNPYLYMPRMVLKPGFFQYRRVYRQLAFYGEAVRNVLLANGYDAQNYSFEYRVLAVETTGRNRVELFGVSPDWIFAGLSEYREIFERIKRYIAEEEENKKQNGLFYGAGTE